MDEVRRKYVEWPLCVTRYQVSFVLWKHRRWRTLQTTFVVGCWRLLAAAFVSAASTQHLSAFEAGGTLSR